MGEEGVGRAWREGRGRSKEVSMLQSKVLGRWVEREGRVGDDISL